MTDWTGDRPRDTITELRGVVVDPVDDAEIVGSAVITSPGVVAGLDLESALDGVQPATITVGPNVGLVVVRHSVIGARGWALLSVASNNRIRFEGCEVMVAASAIPVVRHRRSTVFFDGGCHIQHFAGLASRNPRLTEARDVWDAEIDPAATVVRWD